MCINYYVKHVFVEHVKRLAYVTELVGYHSCEIRSILNGYVMCSLLQVLFVQHIYLPKILYLIYVI